MKQLFWQLKKAYGLIFHYPVSRIESRGVDYDAYWRDKRPGTIGLLSEWQKQRADLALRYVGDGVESIADIGSGDGAMLKYIRENSAVKKGIAVDVSDVVLEQASKFGFETIKADINKVEDRKKIPEADYIFMFEILEHIPDSEEFLRLMLQKSKKGVLFSFPNTVLFHLSLFIPSKNGELRYL